jgi:hypothetical protein
MRIPGAEHAVIDPFKIRSYLLSTEHPIGRQKAAFFAMLGYRRANWREFAQLMQEHVATEHAMLMGVTQFGTKYAVVAFVTGQTSSPTIISVWIVRTGETFSRLVTAYPGGIR